MAEPIHLDDRDDPEDPAAEGPAHVPDGLTVPHWRDVPHLGGLRATSPRASAYAAPVRPDHDGAFDPDAEEQRPGVNEEPGSTATAEPVSDTHGEEGPLEPAVLPGAVATVWSNILSTALRRLQKGQ
ncbi:hypothetical protein [Streptomyces sp. NPDC056361]|uniref:hypothetical protein n=1 Tax=Streptomyces sp. NPDC056361 TaxID=3345795 RepID=UPI0035D8CFC8